MRPRFAHILLALAFLMPATVQAEPVVPAQDAQGGVCLTLLGPSIDPPVCRQIAHDTVTYVGGGPVAHDVVDLVFDSLEPVWDLARDTFCIYETGDIIHCLVDNPSG